MVTDVAAALVARDERIVALEAELAQVAADWEKLALPVDGFTGEPVNIFGAVTRLQAHLLRHFIEKQVWVSVPT